MFYKARFHISFCFWPNKSKSTDFTDLKHRMNAGFYLSMSNQTYEHVQIYSTIPKPIFTFLAVALPKEKSNRVLNRVKRGDSPTFLTRAAQVI